MYTKQSKKMIAFDILEILRQYTDANHRFSQRDIERRLAEKYDMVVDRKSVKRNIMDLIDLGIDIQYTELIRTVRDKTSGKEEEQSIMTDFYIEREFADCEIRLLIDELLDSKYIPGPQRRQLIRKLEGLSNVYFRKNRGAIRRQIEGGTVNNQLFFSLEIIDEAIRQKSKVKFRYTTYKAGDVRGLEENSEEHIVTPLETEAFHGKYLLSCYDENHRITEFRLDYISDIHLTEDKADFDEESTIIEKEPQKMTVKFATKEGMLNHFVDTFGYSGLKVNKNDDEITVVVSTEPSSAIEFGTRYSSNVTVLEPLTLRNEVINLLQKGLNRYNKFAS